MLMPPNDADTVLRLVLAEDLSADSPPRRLTRAQAAELRSLMLDEGLTRAEALAEVRS